MIRIFSGNTLVAKYNKDTNMIESINSGKALPLDLFEEPFGDKVDMIKFTNWVSKRIFPESRCGVDELIKEMGLEKYEPMKMVRMTNAILVSDDYSVRWD